MEKVMEDNLKSDLKKKMKEAKAYHGHGLYQEALVIYEELLGVDAVLDEALREEIQARIAQLKTEIEAVAGDDSEKLTSEDLSLIQGVDIEENVPEILNGAAAFKELGLHREALNEYNKLFKVGYPAAKIIPEMAQCLFELHSPSRVIDKIDGIIEENQLTPAEKVDIKFKLGLEMERRGHEDLALEFYETVKELDPYYQPETKYKLTDGQTDGSGPNRADEADDPGDVNARINALLAHRSFDSRYSYLLEHNLVTTDQLQGALAQSKKSGKSVEHVLVETFKISRKQLGKSLSYFFKCPFKEFDVNRPVPYELIVKLKKAFLLQELWVPLAWGKEGIEVMIDNPSDLNRTDRISVLLNTKRLHFCVGTKEDIEATIAHFYKEQKQDFEQPESRQDTLEDFIPDIEFEEVEEEEVEEASEASGQVVKFVDQLLITAFRQHASDIHIEPLPGSQRTMIRLRIDGVCQEYMQVPIALERGIISRLKIMAGLNIAEKRLPQDGKIKFKRKGIPPFELRLATLPTAEGYEDAVLRILSSSVMIKLDEMGLGERNLKVMERIIFQPYGLILCVGPTGSGKTTTLHSALNFINRPGIKIWTAEDPVEITQPGLRQVQVNYAINLDFARIMRAFLRADPDVIMIGEMRDEETAAIGIEASLTGHLVLSTLHTNSAPETVTRLLDMGLNPLNFSDAFLGVIAQRLVRKICKNCADKYHPSPEEFKEIVRDYGEEDFPAAIKYSDDLTLYRIRGCPECSNTGYRGRVAIHELLEGTKTVKRMIKTQANTEDLFLQGIKDGMTTLRQDGIQKVFQGLTDMNEVRRVCVG